MYYCIISFSLCDIPSLLIYSFNKYVLGTYCVPDKALGPGSTTVYIMGKIPPHMDLTFWSLKQIISKTNK